MPPWQGSGVEEGTVNIDAVRSGMRDPVFDDHLEIKT